MRRRLEVPPEPARPAWVWDRAWCRCGGGCGYGRDGSWLPHRRPRGRIFRRLRPRHWGIALLDLWLRGGPR